MTSHSRSILSYQQATKLNQVGDKKIISERDKIVTQEEHQWPWENTARSDLDHIDTTDIIWVPAAKHPQIAPNEFLEWIKTHGGTTPYNKNPVKRQRSTLSTTYTSSEEEEDDDDDDDDDDEDENRISLGVNDSDLPASFGNSNSPINTTTTNDTNLPELHQPTIPLDTSPVLASQEKPALARRKALSSRGPRISRQQTSIEHTTAKKPSDKNNLTYDNNNNNTARNELTSTSSDGIRLYDQPVDINEWVDLGNVIEGDSRQQLFHRMHTAETHALERQISALETPSSPSAIPRTRKRQGLRRSVSDRLSWTPNGDRKDTSWIRGLFSKPRVADDSSTSAVMGTFIPASTLSSQVSSAPSSPSLPISSSSSSSISPPSPTPTMPRSSSLNLISYLSRKLSFSSAPFTSSTKLEKQPNQHSRRRYSKLLLPSGRNSTRKHQVTPIEFDWPENEQRLPSHLERAVYRLSHMKLANPRRSLREQVTISNFMFWYLSIINMHPQQIQQQQPQQQLLDHHAKSTTNHLYTNDTSSSYNYELETENIQLEKPTSPISHSVHMPLKRPPTDISNKDLPEKANRTPTTRPASSPLALKNKKDKYKPVKNTYFSKQMPDHTTNPS